jgi:hypothetical protein
MENIIKDLKDQLHYIVQREIESNKIIDQNIDAIDEFVLTDEFKQGQEILDPVTGKGGVIIGYTRRTYQVPTTRS